MQNQTTQFINSYNFVPASGYSSAAWQNDGGGGYQVIINDPTPDVFTAVNGLNQYAYIDANDGNTTYTLTATGSSSTPGGGPITFGVTQAPPSSPTAIISLYIELNQLRTNYAEVAGSDFTVSVYDDVRITGNDIVTLRNRSNVDPVTIVSDYDNVEHTWSFHANSEMEIPGNIISVNNINIKAGDAVTITSNNTGTINTWQFDETGLLTLPSGNVTIGSQFGAQAILSNNEPFGVVSQGNAGTVLQWMDDISNTSLLSAVYINSPGANVGDIQVRAGDISSPNVWTFAADGTLTIPSSITGTGASPAPSLFGFDSLDAININASGNMSASYFIGDGSLLTGLGNVSTINLDGNASNILYGNGSFAAAPSGGGYGDSNVATLLSSFGSNTISTTGNVTANNFSGNISITGNISGTSPNVSLVAGSFTCTFDNTGKLTLPAMGGDEGGEINFGIPASNTTLNTRVVVDVYQDRLRIFDGSTKGAYIDLSQAVTGVGTLLNNRVSGFVNAGAFVIMDNIKATVTTTGNRGLSLATVSGSFAYSIGGTYGMATPASGGSAGTGTLTTTPTASIFNWGFTSTGDTATYIITNTSSLLAYRITLQIGASFNNNMISIERLI
jgi:hypothetical protein